MFCPFLTFVFFLLTKVIVYTFLLFVVLILGLKLWIEPVIGVCKCKTKLDGRVALITGGNSGIGLETARDLAGRGARVIIASRDEKKAEQVIADIRNTTPTAIVEFKYLNLASFESIRKFARDFNENEERLDILVNNAGCGGLKKKLTPNGVDLVMQINYLGPFLLTNLLLDKLRTSKPSRIVIVSSYGHVMARFDPNDLVGAKTNGYWTRYANSKLCNVLWAKALAKKLPAGVTANSLHPGVVKTDIFKRIPEVYRKVVLKVIEVVFKTAAEGAQCSIHLCVAPELVNASGGYYRDCKPDKVSSLVTNELVDRVWEESVKLVEQFVD